MEVDWWQLQTSIITEVKKYPCVTEADCRRIWKGLRDKYVREIRLGSTRNVDGTLLSARSQWPFLRRLDFLRDHIRPKRQKRFSKYAKFTRPTGTASQEEEPDRVDYNESTSTDVMTHVFACQDAAVEDVSAEGRWGSPVDFEIDVSPGPSDAADHSMDEGEAAAPSSSAPDFPSNQGLRRRRADGIRSSTRGKRKRGRPTSKTISRDDRGTAPSPPMDTEWRQWRRRGRPPHGLRLLRRWVSPAKGSSSSDEEYEEEEAAGKVEVDDEKCNCDNAKQERREAAIAVALCRFVTTVVSKMTSSSTPEDPVGVPPPVKTDMLVDAGDGDTLFLLGLRGLMSKLDAESKSRAQIDILKLLQERIADAESRRQESCDEDDEQAEPTANDHASAVDPEPASPTTLH
ncbi:hypothetical protein HPB52_015035 [Rhipicephalus sanguineus]|uniref:MADF domain-containing protein n=1 Tax=Rhipicephalus sanguineus TaxID=34632 RepID=A0A9D4PIZ7_RHISA|nr:hypothetical protein HPB52_015035 [Rhipicephalus sanguineus]